MHQTFLGYRRADESVGVRNHLLILSVTGLTGPTARRIGRAVRGAVVVTLPWGGGIIGEDREAQTRALSGLAAHPNVGAVLVIGANPPRVEEIAGAAEAAGKPVTALCLDDFGHDALSLADRGVREAAHHTVQISGQAREPVPLAALRLGLECGRSDPSSGIAANPLVGRIADRIVDAGGQTIIGETTEWLGAEHLLTERAAKPEVADAIRDAARRREEMALAAGIDFVGTNPDATNVAAGLSSIEEKALGAVAKAGSRPIQGFLAYAEPPSGPGLWVMDAPSYAPESLTGFTAAGCQLLLFTTGVGNSFTSALCPTIKLSANPETCARLAEQLDFEAPGVFTGHEMPEAAADRLVAKVIEVASGSLTWGEALMEGEEVISRFGAAL